MAKDKTKFLLSVSTVLCYITFMPLLFGIAIQKDGISIIVHHENYQAGTITGDSLETLTAGKSSRATIFLDGYADTVHTAVLIGPVGTFYTDSVLKVYEQSRSISIPVWYRPDGKLTIKRILSEKEFPLWSVSRKTVLYLLTFCGPFVLAIIWRYKLKKDFAKTTVKAS